MLSFENYAEYGAQTPDDLVRMGGLQQDDDDAAADMKQNDDDDADAGFARAMDLGDDDDNNTTYSVLVFPEPKPLVTYLGSTHEQFHFDKKLLPLTLPPVPPQIMLALEGGSAVMRKVVAKQMAAVCVQSSMPAIVHGSPLVSLLENTTKDVAPIKKDTYMSYMESCCQLHAFKLACLEGAFPFHHSVTPEKLKKSHDEYEAQVSQMGKEQDAQLDALYSANSANSCELAERNHLLASFITLMERYCLQYIHLLEYFLYTCLVEPHNVDNLIPLEAVLTPNTLPTLKQVQFKDRESIVKDVYKFFDYKRDMQGCVQIESRDKMEAIMCGGEESNKYKGYVPLQTLWNYCKAMNCE
jgi:hypothetical protein